MSSSGKNHLSREISPYLLQHADNPVAWYPWSDEAFAKAEQEDKPIFLSIGFSTCHWCHVMAHESFEDQEVANLLNEHFIAVKVDREELPGVDQIYMAATQSLTGSGGWPLSVFLCPDRRPFYAGTYFPPESRYGRPGFMHVLRSVEQAWKRDRRKILQNAGELTEHIHQTDQGQAMPLESIMPEKGYDMIRTAYEPGHGGFSKAPKFPRPALLAFLLHYHRSTGDNEAKNMVLHTLDQMRFGGIYDHVGGGFHRYSVDSRWRVPHFEKMLYDQAQLATCYLEGFQLTGSSLYKQTVEDIFTYVLTEMRDAAGGFYSAQDADSVNPYNSGERGEGAFFLWTSEEIDLLLDPEHAVIFKDYYGIKPQGNVLRDQQQKFSGRNILYRAGELTLLAEKHNLNESDVGIILRQAGEKLLHQRRKREPPHLDDKIITAWNGLMISALARGYMILGDDKYLRAAEESFDFLMENLFISGELRRCRRQGVTHHNPAGLADYAFLLQGILDLFQATRQQRYLSLAEELSEKQNQRFADPQGGFFDTAQSMDLIIRMKEAVDGAEPSGNSVSAQNCLRLAVLTGRRKYEKTAADTVKAFAETLSVYPAAMPLMLMSFAWLKEPSSRIIIAGAPESQTTKAMVREAYRHFLPHVPLLLVNNNDQDDPVREKYPFLKELSGRDKRTTACVCRGGICNLPVFSPEDLANLLVDEFL